MLGRTDSGLCNFCVLTLFTAFGLYFTSCIINYFSLCVFLLLFNPIGRELHSPPGFGSYSYTEDDDIRGHLGPGGKPEDEIYFII